MTSHRHIINADRSNSLCGDFKFLGEGEVSPERTERWLKSYGAKTPARATCPKCSALHFRAKLPANAELVKRSQEGSYKQYRGVREIRVDGELRAFVCAHNGWARRRWGIHHATNDDRTGELGIDWGKASLLHPGEGVDVHGIQEFASCEAAVYFMLANLSRFPVTQSADEYLVAQAERRAAAAVRRKDELRADIGRLGRDESKLSGELAEMQRRYEVLHGLNLESDEAAAAVRWAAEQAASAVADFQRRLTSGRSYIAKKQAELET